MKTWLTACAVLLCVTTLMASDRAKDFALVDSYGKTQRLSDYAGKIVVMEWTDFQCPCVKKHYDSRLMPNLQAFAKENGVIWISICSSAQRKKGYFQAHIVNRIIKGIGAKPHAYVCDADGVVGRQFGVKNTPHALIVDKDGTIAYTGAFTNEIESLIAPEQQAAGKNPETLVNHVRNALDDLLAGRPVKVAKTRPYGCPVRYKRVPDSADKSTNELAALAKEQ